MKYDWVHLNRNITGSNQRRLIEHLILIRAQSEGKEVAFNQKDFLRIMKTAKKGEMLYFIDRG